MQRSFAIKLSAIAETQFEGIVENILKFEALKIFNALFYTSETLDEVNCKLHLSNFKRKRATFKESNK